ncbi:MAG: DUF885 domain-containing protein [Cellvibrionaceae bacterium]
MKIRRPLPLLALVAVLSACSDSTTSTEPGTAENRNQLSADQAEASQLSAQTQESEKANQLFDEYFMAQVMESPTYQTYLGIKDNQDKWDDLTEAAAEKSLALKKQQLVNLQQNIDISLLNAQTRLSYQLFTESLQNDIDDYQWRYHSYPVNQMHGEHSMVPAMLINMHQITDVKDAQDYIARLVATTEFFDQLSDQIQVRADKNILPPKFVFPHVVRDSRNVIAGLPFDQNSTTDSTLLADFRKKVEELNIEDSEKQTLIESANQALLNHVGPAYETLIATMNALEPQADTRDGVWKFPDGEAFYNNALKRTTTTDLSADDIHTIGLNEVARIHNEMRAIMKSVNFEGELNEFFEFMRTDQRFYKDDSAEGRAEYLAEATTIIDDMRGKLDSSFLTKPKADIEVKAVEAFREKSAGKAFYQRPAPDGSRPGRYYANLYRMSDMPTYQMEALAFHEGIPGHHMQLAISQELQGIPRFRRYGSYTAYTEGWGLYSEFIPKEMGFYQDPYSDFGRLAMELWRACRLVVDTGIHSKQWSREKAIQYLADNTPNPQGDIEKAIERYIVLPSQATAYKIGMLKIQELRQQAEQQLGDKFDIRQYHDLVLKNGPLPLTALEVEVNNWIKASIAKD